MIVALRAAGEPQKAIARTVGVSQAHVSRVLAGTVLSTGRAE